METVPFTLPLFKEVGTQVTRREREERGKKNQGVLVSYSKHRHIRGTKPKGTKSGDAGLPLLESSRKVQLAFEAA
jgi:hypothetical protein